MDHVQTVLNETGNPGQVRETADGKRFIYAYWDGSAPATVAAGQPAMLTYGATVGNKCGPKIAAVAGSTTVARHIVVALQAITVAGWYWFQDKGEVDIDALVTGNAGISAAGKVLTVLTTATVFTYEGTAIAATSVALSREAHASGTACKIYLIGDLVWVAT